MSSLNDPEERARRLARRYEPHVADLNYLVDRIVRETGDVVPYFDPDTGGRDSIGLILGQDPSATALRTRFISPDNPDSTATSTTELTGPIERRRVTFWNAVPWKYAPSRLSAATRDAGAAWLAHVLGLLPVRTVIIMGNDAATVWRQLPENSLPSSLSPDRVFSSPHLSRRGLNRRPGEPTDHRRRLAREAFERFHTALNE